MCRKISKEKFRLIFAMEILLGTNAECTWNFSHETISTFYGTFTEVINADLSRKISLGIFHMENISNN
jgi:hypothetical protein